MSVAILSIGTELTRGELTNGNARWLGERLTELGFEVVEHTAIPDDSAQIGATLVRLGRQVKQVVCTGGLGPTSDDLTASAVAFALQVPVVRQPQLIEAIGARYASLGRAMKPMHEKMADLPQGAEPLPNPVGTAPGFAVQVGQARCFFLPGVPREMEPMFVQSVVPAIRAQAPDATHQVHIRTFGAGESDVADRLADLDLGGSAHEPGITVGYRASFPEVEVKILARAGDRATAQAMAERVGAVARERLGSLAYGGREDSYAAVLGERLRAAGLSLAVAESCTGGLIGKQLTDVPGSSQFLQLDAVTYANEAKRAVLGVPAEVLEKHGAVSGETASAMAEGVRALVDADLAVSVTGIAGPEGGSAEKPVGTVWFGLARKGGTSVAEVQHLKGNRQRVRQLSAHLAMRLVMRALDEDA